MYYLKKYNIVCERSATYKIDCNAGAPGSIYQIAKTAMEVDKLSQEHFYVFCLDTKNNLVGVHDVFTGTLDSCLARPREVFIAALSTPKTAAIVLSHNHPSGDPRPSRQDIELTERMKDAGAILGVRVLDHVIIGEEIYYSMRESGFTF